MMLRPAGLGQGDCYRPRKHFRLIASEIVMADTVSRRAAGRGGGRPRQREMALEPLAR
jgi:hypothetical protein